MQSKYSNAFFNETTCAATRTCFINTHSPEVFGFCALHKTVIELEHWFCEREALVFSSRFHNYVTQWHISVLPVRSRLNLTSDYSFEKLCCKHKHCKKMPTFVVLVHVLSSRIVSAKFVWVLGWCDCYHWIAINDCNLIAIRYLFVKMSKNLKISHTECASSLRARLCAYRHTQSSTWAQLPMHQQLLLENPHRFISLLKSQPRLGAQQCHWGQS